jgi:hypothetical protein
LSSIISIILVPEGRGAHQASTVYSAKTNSGASTKSDFDLLKTIVPAFGQIFRTGNEAFRNGEFGVAGISGETSWPQVNQKKNASESETWFPR